MLTTLFFKIGKLIFGFSFFILFQLYSSSILAQTTSTITNPDWTDDANWTGTAPGYDMNQDATLAHNSTISGNDITVNDGFTLIINAGVTLTTDKVITIKPGGTLIINGTIIGTGVGVEFKIDKGELIINSGGVLDWTGKWNSKAEESTITIDGSVIVRGVEAVNKANISGSGTFEVLGELKNSSPGTVFGCDLEGDLCCPSGSCVLPIELISFYAVNDDTGIGIHWSTATEINNDFFTLERSKDGINWEVIHYEAGAGNSSEILSYSFRDSDLQIGLIYYRLKQTDYDGTYSYSDVIVSNKPMTANNLVCYPNPASDNLSVEMIDIQFQELVISNGLGQRFPIPIKRNLNKLELDISNLKSGLYFIGFANNPSRTKINFIKIQ